MPDIVIHELVKKKKELLSELLQLSIKSIINESDRMMAIPRRERILEDLKRNDRILEIRETQTGIDSIQQERDAYSKIDQIIESIQENNRHIIRSIESQKKANDGERFKLGKEKRLTGYLRQTKMTKSKKALTAL